MFCKSCVRECGFGEFWMQVDFRIWWIESSVSE